MTWEYGPFVIEVSLDEVYGALYHVYFQDEVVCVRPTLDAAYEWCEDNQGRF